MLLKNILGLLPPERGEIWVDGDQIVGLREKRRYEVRKKFGVLSQDSALFGSMNLYDIRFDEPLRQHCLPAARAHLQERAGDPRAGPQERGTGRLDGPPQEAPR